MISIYNNKNIFSTKHELHSKLKYDEKCQYTSYSKDTQTAVFSRWNNNCNVFLNYIWAFILKAHIRKVYENAVEKKTKFIIQFSYIPTKPITLFFFNI